jgi:hypothetical protein
MAKSEKIKILSYTYQKGKKTFVAETEIEKKKKTVGATVSSGCNCGETKCVDGKLRRCMPLDDEGTCIWFITNEKC